MISYQEAFLIFRLIKEHTTHHIFSYQLSLIQNNRLCIIFSNSLIIYYLQQRKSQPPRFGSLVLISKDLDNFTSPFTP